MYISVLETMEKNTENERGRKSRERDGERARMGIAFLIEA